MIEQVESFDKSIYDIEQMKKKDWYRSHAVSTNFTFQDNDKIKTLLVTTGANDITITLSTVVDNLDRVIEIFKDDAGAGKVIIDGEGAETIKTPNGTVTTIEIFYQNLGIRIKGIAEGWELLDYLPSAGNIAYKQQFTIGHNVAIDLVFVQFETFTATKKGLYKFTCSATFSNSRNAGAGMKYIIFALRLGGVEIKRELTHLSSEGGESFIAISFSFYRILNVANTITLGAYAQAANIIATRNNNNECGWIIERLGMIETL
jgi:hypothetical protein